MDLSKQMWTKSGMGFTASMIGNPICVDEATKNRTRLNYARICIAVDIDCTFPISLDFKLKNGIIVNACGSGIPMDTIRVQQVNEIGVETTTTSPCLEIELFKDAPTNGIGSIWENTIVIKDSTTEQDHPVVITEQGLIVVYQPQSGTITNEVSVHVLIESIVEDLQGRKHIQDKDNHSLIGEDFDTADESGTVSEVDHFSDDQGVEEGLFKPAAGYMLNLTREVSTSVQTGRFES
ncbi:hypothetical protein IFM89_035908 [Coptis chinensis]|uniref:Uncharacterized protein n=1 Tax=Coptis chinensis TaxID=261450 RepID=A0A835LDI6_9MAGN|nr:hypothetical protein IFM89_035908 [Coptis chinensis]